MPTLDKNIDLDNPQMLQQVVQWLKELPSGIMSRTAPVTAIQHEPESEAFAHTLKAVQAHKTWKDTQDNVFFEQAITELKLAAESCERNGNALLQAEHLAKYADLCREANYLERAIAPAEEAINLYYQQNRFDKVGENVAKLYPNIVGLQSATFQAEDQQKVELLKAKLRPLRRLQVEAFTRSRNEPVEPTAHNVGQGEAGFSDNAPLGTIQTHDCVCLIVRDPVTKKTALAHIDHLTAAHSLKQILDRLPTPAPPERLQAKLIGARLIDGGPNDPPQKVANSKENIKKISGFLKDNEVDIISTDFSQPPGNLVVDPKTFDVIEATPNMDYPDAVITLGRQSIAFSNDPLRVAFDLTISQERSPVLVSNKSLATLAAYGNNETAIYDWFKNHQYGLGSPLYTELVFKS